MKKLLLVGVYLLVSTLFNFAYSQNSPYSWKNSCNCGVSEMIRTDDHQNNYIFTQSLVGNAPNIIKLKNSNGAAIFNNAITLPGITGIKFLNSFYKAGAFFIAAQADTTNSYSRLLLLKLDTNGIVSSHFLVDSIQVQALSGISSAPYYSAGLFVDQVGNIHVAFKTYNSGNYMVFLKFSSTFSLLNYHAEFIPWSSNAGVFHNTKLGSIYYTNTGQVCKLNATYSGLDWTAGIGTYEDVKIMEDDGAGHLFFVTDDYSIGQSHYNRIRLLTDLGSNYALGFAYNMLEYQKTVDVMVVDSANNAFYVSGYYTSLSPYSRMVQKFNSLNGISIWKDSISSNYVVSKLLLDNNRRLTAVGGGPDYKVWRYNSIGHVYDSLFYDGPCGGNDEILAARFDNTNYLIVTGSTCESSSNVNYGTTMRYVTPAIATGLETENIHNKILLFPNPTSNEVTIDLGERDDQTVEIKCVNVVGQVVYQNEINTQDAILKLNTSSFAEGLYFITLNGENALRKTIKVMIER